MLCMHVQHTVYGSWIHCARILTHITPYSNQVVYKEADTVSVIVHISPTRIHTWSVAVLGV